MNKRRTFLKGAIASGATGAAIGAGLIVPQAVFAARPDTAFDAKGTDGLNEAMGGAGEPSADIKLKAPDIAENGAVVPVSVSTTLPNVESISIIAVNNPNPLAASFEFTANSQPDVSTRIKMGKTSKVIALVKSDGKLYTAEKEVKVTIGGCGG